MNIVRKIHDLFRVKTVAGAQLETPEAVSSLGAGGSTFITIAGGGASLSGSGLSEEDRVKLDSIELGALVNLDAFSKIQFDATSIDENDLSSSSNGSIIANIPTDTANIKIVGNYPITVNLESVSLFNSNTSTTTGTAITTYNISFNDDNNIVIEYVDGALLNVADIELIQIKHKENILATYLLSDITYTTSEGTITSFTIPYSNTDFSEIEFCKYETITTETETGSTTVRELRVLSTLLASPTKQSIITLNSLTDSFWNYEEDENGNKFVWTDYNVYSTKDVSAYGRGTDLGDTYASNLYELKDVVLTNLSNNDLLIYNSSTSKWVNINKDLLGISADLLHTLTISVNGVTQTVYNPASANASINISTITLDEVTEYIDLKIDTKLDASEFFKWFTINYDSNNNVVSIQANFDFYSIEGVSAYGLGEGEEEPSYVSELGLLSDVTLTNVALDNILLYDGNKWVNRPMSSIVVDAYTKSEIDTKLSSISSEISTLKSNVTSILSNITNIQGDITNILSNIATILNSISNITSDISTINATISDILTTLTGKLDKDDFFTWFTIIKNTSGEVVSIQANFDFYSIGEVSAYGLGDIGGSGRTTLATLDDVSLSNLITNDMLAYNGSKWVNIPMSQVRGVTSWADLENKPTTLSGFGITDAYTASLVDSKIAVVSNKLDNFLTGSDTDTIINKWKELESFLAGYTLTLTLAELLSVKANSSVKISAGTGLTGGGDLTANRTISLATSGVTAGTYTKVTVDAYGRVTTGATLLSSDIPNIEISKVNGLQAALNNKVDNAFFARVFGLLDTNGNEIAVNDVTTVADSIKAKFGLWTEQYISALGKNPSSGGGGSASALYQLVDILPNDTNDGVYGASTGKVLMYNGTKWQAGDVVSDISTLTFNVNGSKLFDYNGKSNVTANLTVPTKLSQLTDDVVSGKYLPLSGGTVSNNTRNLLLIKNTDSTGNSAIWFGGAFGNFTSGGIVEYNGNDGGMYLNNYKSYTTNNQNIASLRITSDGNIQCGDVNYLYKVYNILHSGNYNSYVPTLTGNGASGTWGINISGNASTASGLFSGNAIGDANTVSFTDMVVRWYSMIPSTTSNLPTTAGWQNGLLALPLHSNGITAQLYFSATKKLYFRSTQTDNWNEIAYVTDNVASATKLQTARTIWGQSFDGTADISTSSAAKMPYVLFKNYNNDSSAGYIGRGSSDSNTVYLIGYYGNAVSLGSNDRPNDLYIHTSHNVGIGTTSPIYKLHVEGITYSNGGFVKGDSSDSYVLLGGGGHKLESSLSVNYATSAGNADTVDYLHASDFARSRGADLLPTDINHLGYGYGHNSWYTYGPAFTFGVDTYYARIQKQYNSNTLYLGGYSTELRDLGWREFAFTDSNVASATKLQTPRTLWGQSFNGTGNVDGVFTQNISHTTGYSNNAFFGASSATSGAIINITFGKAKSNCNLGYIGHVHKGDGLDTNYVTIGGYAKDQLLNVLYNGNVGIGTTSPSYKLDVNGIIKSNQVIFGYMYGTNSNAAAFVWDKPGSYYTGVGSNGTTDTIRFSACNADGTWASHTQNWQFYGNIAATGAITAKVSSSDIRLKTDITDYKALSIIRNHRSIKYHWNEAAKANADIFNDDDWHFGLIAQELQQEFPQFVKDVFNDYLTIDYERLTPLMWKGIQEVDDEVTRLKKKVRKLEMEIRELKQERI